MSVVPCKALEAQPGIGLLRVKLCGSFTFLRLCRILRDAEVSEAMACCPVLVGTSESPHALAGAHRHIVHPHRKQLQRVKSASQMRRSQDVGFGLDCILHGQTLQLRSTTCSRVCWV